ncbi:MAG: hypothetical protein JJ931_17450 [Henriciella sp.]|jgi:hypothetical protein|nr:hypothetical protein [Henriciella sp.]
MLLRRITKHVKDQNWFAVGIDFFIVVFGVFIGIQVSNWNDVRTLNGQSEVFTESLKSDLRVEAWNYHYLIEYFDDVQTSGKRALKALTSKSQFSDEALLINAYRATQTLVNVRTRSTFDELTSTGNIALIRDDKLLDAAIWIYNDPTFEDIITERNNAQYRQLFRKIIPLEVQDALLENCGDRIVVTGDYENIIDSLDYDCETDLPPALLAEAANALRMEVSIIPLLRLRMANVKTYTTNFTVFNLETRQTLDALTTRIN